MNFFRLFDVLIPEDFYDMLCGAFGNVEIDIHFYR